MKFEFDISQLAGIIMSLLTGSFAIGLIFEVHRQELDSELLMVLVRDLSRKEFGLEPEIVLSALPTIDD